MPNSFNSRSLFDQSVQKLTTLYDQGESESLIYWALEDLVGISRADVALNELRTLDARKFTAFTECVESLRKGKPIQHILGYTYFLGRRFKVSPVTLIPRPETEELVNLLLEENEGYKTVLDIGTGTGCIPISIKIEHPDFQVSTWDVSSEALKIARENSKVFSTDVVFLEQDVFQNWPQSTYDVIVSNPPYITDAEKPMMHKNVLYHEPEEALFVPDDKPLIFYERILDMSRTKLNSGGVIYFEINEAFGKEVVELCAKFGFKNVELMNDFFGKDRMVSARRN